MKIIIIDYKLGNSKSILNILYKIGYHAKISNDKQDILSATHLILPGVGHFKKGMENLKSLELIEVLNEKVLKEKTPILGICLGMHLMTKFSQEGFINGLGWVDAEVVKFGLQEKTLKVPHMGWNEVFFNRGSNYSFIENPPRFYFVHSYYVKCNKVEDVLSISSYGLEFTSSFLKDNIFGVQFHPEKSHKFGMEIFKIFLNSATP